MTTHRLGDVDFRGLLERLKSLGVALHCRLRQTFSDVLCLNEQMDAQRAWQRTALTNVGSSLIAASASFKASGIANNLVLHRVSASRMLSRETAHYALALLVYRFACVGFRLIASE